MEKSADLDLEELHQILNCASQRGCAQCVRCSESALERLLAITRSGKSRFPAGVERLELDMDLVAILGM